VASVIHRQPIKVRFYELDPYNHLNHSAYVQYFEVGRVELLEALGFGLADLQARGQHLVVAEIHTRFISPARAHDELVVETWVHRLRRASTTWEQRLRRDGAVLATQTVTAAMTDPGGTPTRFPVELTEALQPYVAR
jgi:acyl-CoA thioester hydrolase